jgi:chromosome segregation ATPase
VTRILKLINNEDQGRKGRIHKDPKKELALVGLIEDFYKQYQSLYAMFDHLRRELGKVGRGRKENEVSFSNSSSDSEYLSSEEVDSSNGNVENEHQEAADRKKQELDTAEFKVADLMHKLASTSLEKEALNLDYKAALSKIQEAEIINKNVRIEADKRERELLAIIKVHEIHANQASAQIKELESQLTGLKVEVKSFRGQKRDMESRIESKATEAKQLKEKNTGLHAQISELELLLKDKEGEASSLMEKLKDNENYSTSKIADLMSQASNLQLEVNSLYAQKGELEERMVCERNKAFAQVKGLMGEVTVMEMELETLHSQKAESYKQMEKENKETSKYMVAIETLKGELAKRSMAEQRMLDEKEGFLIQVKDLELEVESLHNQENELEELIKNKICETNQLWEEKEGVHDRNVELERALTEKEDKLSALQNNYEIKENEASTQVMTLAAQVNMIHDLDSLLNKKSQLELQAEKEKQESSKRPSQVESQNTRKIADGQRVLKNNTMNTTSGEHRQSKVWLQKNKLNPQIVERKIEEVADEFRKNLEDKIRLLYQRILVSEQLHTENKDNYKRTKNLYEQEIGMLEEKVATYEAQLRKMSYTLETTSNALSEADLLVKKFEEYDSNVVSRITNMLHELQFAKDWVTKTNNEIKRLMHKEGCLVSQLDDKEEEEFILRERVWKLEAKLSNEGGEKLNLMKATSQLEKKVGKLEKNIKEKDEELCSLGEEKREAIRQLCLLIDYHRSRYDHLKQLMPQMKK